MFQDSPLPPTCLHLPRHSLSTGASREASIDKRAHQDANSSYSRIARRQPSYQELMCQDSPLPPTCLHLPRHSLSTGASREPPVDKRAHQDTNSSYSRIARRQPTCQELMFQVCCSRHAKGKRQDYSITTIQKHHIRATRQKHHSKAITENNTTSNRKDKRTTAERKYKSTTAWETLVGSSTKAACAAVTLGSRHTPLHEHGVSPDEEKRLECARCYRARAARCWSM